MRERLTQLKELLKTENLAGEGIAPDELSRQLRDEDNESLANRRRIVAGSMVAAGAMAVVGLYQTGLIRRIPEPPLPFLDAEKVDASEEAYEQLGAPDGLIGLRSYATTMVLASIGGKNRPTTHPLLTLALAAKVTADSAQALRLTRDQWTKHGAFCSWCLLAAGATLSSVKPAYQEAASAVRSLLS